MVSFEEIKKLICNYENIGLTYHVSPDGDAVGSLIALKLALKKLNKNVKIFSKDNLQKNNYLNFLTEVNEVDGTNYIVNNEIDLLIIVDCGNLERVSCEFDANNVITLGIDHHVSNEKYCNYNLVVSSSSSTGEIIYDLIKYLNIEIDKDIASCIYTSIMTDTGGLHFESTSQKTFNIVGELVSVGIDFYNIYEKLFLSQSYSKVKLLSLVYEKLKIIDEKICVTRVTEEMLKLSNSSDEETGNISSLGLTIENVCVSIFIKKFKDKVKVSMRSKGNINVCEVAQMFGGGGHLRAAAFVTELKMDEIEELLVKKFRSILND